MRLIVVPLFYIFVIVGAFVRCAPADEVATVYTSYFSRVMVDDPEKPGFGYEIVAELFKIAGEKFKVVPLPWARAQYMVQNTPGALIFPLSWTPTREPDYLWKVNIFNNQTHFISFNKTKLTAESAKGKLIGVQMKSSWDNWLSEHGYTNVYRVTEEGSELVKLLRNNRIDTWFTDRIIADSALKDLKDANITYSDPIQIFRTYLATSKVAPYRHMDKLEAAMKTLRQSDKFDQILQKYNISQNF